MAKKEHIPTKRVSENVYQKHFGKDKKDSDNVTIYVEYIWNRPHTICIISNHCSESCMEHLGDYDIEHCIFINDEAAHKLANKFSARDEKTLVSRMANRFRIYGKDVFSKIEDWLKLKGIEYSTGFY